MNNNFGSTFAPTGQTIRIDFANDSSINRVALPQVCTAVQILSTENCVINFSADEAGLDSQYPTVDGEIGDGCVVQGNWQTVLAIPQSVYNTTTHLYVTIASDQSGYALISTGVLV
jgi:hypothetical protein